MEESVDFSFDDIPGFFTNGSVDDKKYENLLEDLRAHDLLGPSEGHDDHGGAGSSSSLFFNDAFSAIFMGQFDGGAMLSTLSSKPEETAAVAKLTGSKTSAPPPGFARKPPGLAPTDVDLKWARGQEDFARITSSFTGLPDEPTVPNLTQEVDTESIDESQIPSLRALGLDDDESRSPQKTRIGRQTSPQNSPVKLPAPPPVASPPRSPPRSHGATPVPPPAPVPPPPGAWQHPPMGPPMQMPMPIPGPPGMMPFGHPPPGAMPPFVPPPRPFKMMTPRDVSFVVQQQMKQLRSSDPFSDDYYFHNYWMKRTRASQPGMAPNLPLPSWKLGHVRSIDPRDAQRANSSRQWESQHHVLGRNENRSLYTPKQLVNLVASNENANVPKPPSSGERKKMTAAEFAQTVRVLRMPHDSAKDSVFTNETWFRRHRIDRGLQCLLSLQEARHILDARGINVQQFHSLDDSQMDPALVELRARTAKLLVELAAILGVVLVENSDPECAQEPMDGSSASTHSLQCDKKALTDMMAVQKGKKLVSRALPLLHPSARFLLFPAVLEILLGSATAGSINNEELDNEEASTKVCETLVLMLLYHPPTPPAEVFADSLANALEGHSIESLRIILHNRPRAEVLQALLQKGADSVHDKGDVDSTVLEKWNWYQDLFVKMATAIKESSM